MSYISMNQRTKFPFHYAAIAARDANDNNNALDETKQMVSIARAFLFRACPTHHLMAALDDLNSDQRSSEDRLVKIGRNVCSTLKVARRNAYLALSREEKDKAVPLAEASLSLLVDECNNLAAILSGAETRKVPKKRFGKTELQMPVLSLGCMRFQQSWNRGKEVVLDLTSVEAECQKNLVEIIKHAVRCGVTHIETAQMYGTSEMQIGPALRTLFDSGFVKREDLIIQTKGALSSSMTPADYKKQILDSLELLQLDYVDLFSVHGVNMDCDYEWLFHSNSSNDKGNLISTLHELKAEGKIRHIGFSTHGRAELIRKFIDSDAFEYCNIHYHFCGSYTASGDAEFGGNLSNIRLAHEKDMGVFIISAYDKGGRMYAPSNKLRELTLPDMEPITYGSVWLWQHDMHDAKQAPCHTIVCGAARPSDLDQPVMASLMLSDKRTAEKRKIVSERLSLAMDEALGKDWVETWHIGLPNSNDSKYMTQHGNIVWLHNIIKAFGLLDYAKERVGPLNRNIKKYDSKLSKKDNMVNLGMGWGWMPGCAVDPKLNYEEDFAKCPEENRERLQAAIMFVHDQLMTSPSKDACEDEKNEKHRVPFDWKTSYDMRPWTAYPER